ncbi:MAG TPA: pitrilysin family protein [Verrucomicrobiae bacterium]|nr:pitrilysin family protein [Verrucomicrobiae bacterium]
MKPIARDLKNGLKAIAIPLKGAESATIMVMVRVGSRYETKEINGASHFIEHLMFKGTKRRPSAQHISRELDRYGADYNAFTSKDMTAYYVKIDASRLPLAVDILHDMLFHSKFDSKEIDRERTVIVEEINMYEDNPRMHIEDMLEETLFAGSTLGWNIAGPREVIRSITPAQLTGYRDAYYIPSRMCVVVAGKLPANIWSLLQKTFGSVREPSKSRDHGYEAFIPGPIKKPVSYQNKTTEQVQLSIAFHGVALEDKRLPAANLLANILGGTMSSRLFSEVREKRGLCYAIAASHQAMEDSGVFTISSGLDKTRCHEAVEVIWKELKKIATTPVGPDELRRSKDFVRGKLTLALEDSSAYADWYGRQWLFQKKLESPEQRLKRLEAVTAKELKSLAKELFRKEHMAAAVIGPFGAQENADKLFA